MKTLRQLGLLMALLAGAGFLASWAGVIPIAASSGHWPITAWFLHFTMRQSVETRTIGNSIPDRLEESGTWRKAAKHYATGCAPCHGSPGAAASGITKHMTPPPPHLPDRVPEWKADELFWIVKHGVKFTGMPAWPTQRRDDEIWAMVGFLRRLPQLSPAEYANITGPPRGSEPLPEDLDEALRQRVESCARCHRADGAGGQTGAFPRLANQSRLYLEASLSAYAGGRRYSGIMQPIAGGLSKEERKRLAEYYARVSAPPPSPASLPGSPDEGKRIAERGIPRKGIPSCLHCHGPTDTPRNPFYPKLAGQHVDYLVLQLELFKAGNRGGTAFAHIMHESVDRMTRAQIRDVASYYAGLKPGAAHEEGKTGLAEASARDGELD